MTSSQLQLTILQGYIWHKCPSKCLSVLGLCFIIYVFESPIIKGELKPKNQAIFCYSIINNYTI